MNEGFDFVFEGETVDEQVTRLKEWGQNNQCLVPVVRMGVGAEKPEWNLPEGMPETVKLEEDTPDGLGATSIQIEWRRIKQFTDPNSNMKNLPDWKQEMNWLQILEGVHPEEAKILTAVKDGSLLGLYPKLEKLMEPLGITEYNKPKKVRKPRKKKEV
tara:strand:- start:901 stop:1374 length:474 start_codon:yes stop_codon:yes gene_type:complete